jgi:hypothetical protein
MKLIDRLKKEYKDKLELHNASYPILIGLICLELEEITLVSSMRYGIWKDLYFFTGVQSPYDLFDEIE